MQRDHSACPRRTQRGYVQKTKLLYRLQQPYLMIAAMWLKSFFAFPCDDHVHTHSVVCLKYNQYPVPYRSLAHPRP